jgi:DNA sulfur modification protein DndD
VILDRLVIHNFGVYRGRHALDLAPPSRQKPLVLLGALNGGGKTTFLDALQLVLYGKLAHCSNRGDSSYEDYLRNCINRQSDPRDGAALELQFRHTIDGENVTYTVRRSWTASDRSTREHLDVLRNGAPDPVLSENWQDHIEQIIPVRLSRFFFFDGEKIEALADIDNSRETLSTAIHSLLGLDLVDQLSTDLTVLERRKRMERKEAGEREKIDQEKSDLGRIEAQRAELTQKAAAARNDADRASRDLDVADARYREAGGEAYERRLELEGSRRTTADKLARIEDDLREVAAGTAPLLLVRDLISEIEAIDRSDAEAEVGGRVLDVIEKRDRDLLSAMKNDNLPVKVLKTLDQFLSRDRQTRHAKGGSVKIGLNARGRMELAAVNATLATDVAPRIDALLTDLASATTELDRVDRLLASVPDKEAIMRLSEDRDAAKKVVDDAGQRLALLEGQVEFATRERNAKADRLAKLMDADVRGRFSAESGERMVRHSSLVRDALTKFRGLVVLRHVRRIEELVLQSFQQLLRKTSLVTEIKIDPTDFTLTLLDASGDKLASDRLSAGERQLLAVSLIWGLARASGRPIPVVVDTPLGRLDSIHRKHLVERYFPVASHQVLLLSTDEEIDEELFGSLKPVLGRTYTLTFDDASRATSATPGYFWN